MLRRSMLKNLSLGYSLARSAHFTAQGFAMSFIDYLATGKKRELPKEYATHLKEAFPKVQKLLEHDSLNITEGLYPLEVLQPEGPIEHFLRLPQLVKDAYAAHKRREQKSSKDFSEQAEEYVAQMPDYYARNFHFQTDGYLSDTSAQLYEHQVEILFSGSADAMRRLIIPMFKEQLGANSTGEGLRFLELGSGTGRLTKFMSLAFPKAHITAVDLSPHYHALARQRMKNFKRVDFVTAQAEQLPFLDQSFDVVYSCYLFHELPRQVRELVTAEAQRVLKPGGLYGVADSIQKDDDSELNWALERFPVDFHEPFYKDYTLDQLYSYFEKHGLQQTEQRLGFLTKALVGVKPAKP